MNADANVQKLAAEALDARRAENCAERKVAEQLLIEWAVWAGIGVRSHDYPPDVLARFLPRTEAGMPLRPDTVYLAVDRAVARLPFRLARVVEVEYRTRGGGTRAKAQRAGLPRLQYRATLEAAQYAVWCQLTALGVVRFDTDGVLTWAPERSIQSGKLR